MRDFRTRNKKVFDDHITGRKCDNKECNGDLFDTIVNFGEGINKPLLKRAAKESDKADLCLCLGSSLSVKPAMLLPQVTASNGGKVAIVNLQKTPLDKICSLRIFAKVDEVIEQLMKKLSLETKDFKLKRYISIKNH